MQRFAFPLIRLVQQEVAALWYLSCDRLFSVFLCSVTSVCVSPAGWTGSSCSGSRRSSTLPPPELSLKTESSELRRGGGDVMTRDTAAGRECDSQAHEFNPLTQAAQKKVLLNTEQFQRAIN